MKLNIKSFFNILSALGEYLFAYEKLGKKFKKISDIKSLEIFVNERSAFVTQTTLYGYLKTRMGLKYTLMFSDDVFIQSVNKSKWNIFIVAVSDLTLFTVSSLIKKDFINEKQYDLISIYSNIIKDQLSKGMPSELYEHAITSFKEKISKVNIHNYIDNNPFYDSGQALYKWSPVADDLKILDKEIVLNSIKNKWNTVINEFNSMSSKFNN